MAEQIKTPATTPDAKADGVKSGLAATEQPMKPFVAAPETPAAAKPQGDPKSADSVTPGTHKSAEKADPAAKA